MCAIYQQQFKLDRFGRLVIRNDLRCVDTDGAFSGASINLRECHTLRSGFWQVDYDATSSQVVQGEDPSLCWVPQDSPETQEVLYVKLSWCAGEQSAWFLDNAHVEGRHSANAVFTLIIH